MKWNVISLDSTQFLVEYSWFISCFPFCWKQCRGRVSYCGVDDAIHSLLSVFIITIHEHHLNQTSNIIKKVLLLLLTFPSPEQYPSLIADSVLALSFYGSFVSHAAELISHYFSLKNSLDAPVERLTAYSFGSSELYSFSFQCHASHESRWDRRKMRNVEQWIKFICRLLTLMEFLSHPCYVSLKKEIRSEGKKAWKEMNFHDKEVDEWLSLHVDPIMRQQHALLLSFLASIKSFCWLDDIFIVCRDSQWIFIRNEIVLCFDLT